MFEKEEIKNYLNQLELDKNEYYMIAGGILVFHGIKEKTEDIDLVVSEKGLKQLQEKYDVRKSIKNYPNLYTINDDLEVILDDIKGKPIFLQEGIPCNSILAEWKWKKEKNRLKDKQIITELEELLEKISKHDNCKIEDLTEEQVEKLYKNIK